MPGVTQRVASFAPELIALYKRASESEVIIPRSTSGDCINLRMRLHRLRAAMRKEQHFMLSFAERVTVVIRELDGQHVVICKPADEDIKEALKKAGVSVDDLYTLEPPPPLADTSKELTKEDEATLDMTAEEVVKNLWGDPEGDNDEKT